MTNTDKARYVVERLGLCWHEPLLTTSGMELLEWDKDRFVYICRKCGHQSYTARPTFLDPAGRIQLLELMEKYPLFFAQLIYGTGKNVEAIDDDGYIPREYLKEEGLLLDAAYRFLKEKNQ
jgi:hypothetical protein